MAQAKVAGMMDSNVPTDGLMAFALGIYSDGSVRQSCLHLQDTDDADVNLVLWGAWMACVRHIPVDASLTVSAAARVSVWHRDIVRNLRTVRHLLKEQTSAGMDAQVERLRDAVKKVEIDSEIIELERLARFSQDIATDRGGLPLTLSEIAISVWTAASYGSGNRPGDSSRQAVETIARTGMEWSSRRTANNSSGEM